ncbi:MAG: hypothetical protein QOK25_1692 [Thermoleophilaceae bacterium]|jgi:hypothetical protein|nr:hypothetical protein [Thermoleophilaceae bacterium]
MTLLAAVACVAAVVAAVGLLRLSSETAKRACVESAVARYPAVPVTAFLTTSKAAIGPQKLSFVRERTLAVNKCD